MKKLFLTMAAAVLTLVLASCGKEDYKLFVGTWGVETIKYYNLDYAGNPIAATVEYYQFTPGDPDNGIDLVFRADKTGEMRDRSRDTLLIPVYEDEEVVDTTIIICPDTTIVTRYTYSYDAEAGLLYMNMQVERPFTYRMEVNFVDDNTFDYVNQYDVHVTPEYSIIYVEQAHLVRISKEARNTKRSTSVYVPRHWKSALTGH